MHGVAGSRIPGGLIVRYFYQLVEGKPVERCWTVHLFVAAWRTYDWPKLYRLLSIQPQRIEESHYRSTFYSCPSPFPLLKFPSLCCQTLLTWQGTWAHPSPFAFRKGKSTTCLNSHLSFDRPNGYAYHQSFAGIQFDFAKCSDSIPHSVIWA